jgi:hypothetical protein
MFPTESASAVVVVLDDLVSRLRTVELGFSDPPRTRTLNLEIKGRLQGHQDAAEDDPRQPKTKVKAPDGEDA